MSRTRTTRRGAAALAAAPLADQPNDDPIFAAIERHRGAYAVWDACLGVRGSLEKAERPFRLLENIENEKAKAALADEHAADDAEQEAFDVLLATPVRTLAGLRALIDYLGKLSPGFHEDDLVEGLLGSLGKTLSSISPPTLADDAELLELGRQLEPLLARWSTRAREGDLEQAEIERECYASTGVHPDFMPKRGEPGYEEYERTRLAIIERQHSDPKRDAEDEREYTRINREVKPILKSILSQRARTIAGLAVKARAAAFMEDDLWRDEDENVSAYDLEHPLLGLIEDICRMAGVPSLAEETGSWSDRRSIALRRAEKRKSIKERPEHVAS